MSLAFSRRPRGLRGTPDAVVRLLIGLCVSLLLGSVPLSCWAAETSISFDEAVRRAVERAPALDMRRAQTVAAQEEARRAAALPDPKLSVGI